MSTYDRSAGSDPMEVLRRANPVPAERRAQLAAQLETPTAASEVIARARRSRVDVGGSFGRRHLTAIAAVVVMVLAAFPLAIGPAFGFGPALYSFSNSNPPPQQLKTVIFSLAQGAPRGMDPGLLPDKARVITSMRLNGQNRDLWAAPTSAGGMCYGWAVAGGGCDRFGTTPLSVSWAASSDRQSISTLRGYVQSRYASEVDIRFADGEVVHPLLVKVTAPINAAFFSYDVPQDRQNAGKTVVAVAARDASGKVVTEQVAPVASVSRPSPIADAQLGAKRAAVQLASRHGPATIWTAPTRYGGRCAWSEFEGQLRFLAYCHPARYDFDQFGIVPIATQDDVLLTSTLSSTIDSVLVRFADGAEARIAPQNGFLLYEIPSSHLMQGHQAILVVGLDRAGKEVNRLDLTALGPCFPLLPTTSASLPASCASEVIGRSG
jgi:hypothetical protein